MGLPVEPPPSDPLLGRTLMDRYLVERKLGEGGMGAVYVARHLVLDKPVALKVLHGELMRKPELRDRFLNEARAASRIRHENIIDITDFGTTPEGAVFFAMELLAGRDLHAELGAAPGNRLPWTRSRAIFLQVCSALSAAHRLGIIHRDLKPENIYLVEWLGHRDFVKLLDFGIAKTTEVAEEGGEARKLTRTGMLFGTPEYMAPEQARGEKPDQRVDIYAMGCILFQLVTGRVPFTGDTFMAVLSQHLSTPPPSLGDTIAEVGAPPGLEEVVARALAKDRDQRYPTCEALAAAIRTAEDAAHMRRPSAAPRGASGQHEVLAPTLLAPWADAAPPVQRRRLAAPIVGLAVIAILVAVIAILLANRDGGPDRATPTQPVTPPAASAPAPASREPTQAPAHDAVSPTGTRATDDQPGDDRADDTKASRPRRQPSRPAAPQTRPDKPASTPPPDDEPRLGDVEPKDPFESKQPSSGK